MLLRQNVSNLLNRNTIEYNRHCHAKGRVKGKHSKYELFRYPVEHRDSLVARRAISRSKHYPSGRRVKQKWKPQLSLEYDNHYLGWLGGKAEGDVMHLHKSQFGVIKIKQITHLTEHPVTFL